MLDSLHTWVSPYSYLALEVGEEADSRIRLGVSWQMHIYC